MVKKKNKRLSITITKTIGDTLKLYCKESKDDLEEINKMIGRLAGTDIYKDKLLNTLMLISFFSGVFITKNHPNLIKKFEYEEIKVNEEPKIVVPNYMG